MTETRIIINADDLGLSEDVNRAIFDLMANRRITSATLMANSDFVEQAARQAKEFKQYSFGAHLCLTELKPLTKNPDLQPLLDGNGNFNPLAVRQIKPTTATKKAVFEEWSQQIRLLKSLGASISHIDSHHHIHTWPWLFPILKRIQKTFGIRKVRITMNLYLDAERPSRLRLANKSLYNMMLRYYYRTKTTDAFTSFKRFLILGRTTGLRFPCIELMTHPGNPLCKEETGTLHSPWQEDMPFPVRLISYNDL